jgi:hypothetical protein
MLMTIWKIPPCALKKLPEYPEKPKKSSDGIGMIISANPTQKECRAIKYNSTVNKTRGFIIS